jgi:hypothetical protein
MAGQQSSGRSSVLTCPVWCHVLHCVLRPAAVGCKGERTMALAPPTRLTAFAVLLVFVVASQAVDGATSAECGKVRASCWHAVPGCYGLTGSLWSMGKLMPQLLPVKTAEARCPVPAAMQRLHGNRRCMGQAASAAHSTLQRCQPAKAAAPQCATAITR